MKKNRIIKGILLLIVLAVLSMGFTGCGALLATTGTVYLIIDAWDDYDIYMDSSYKGYSYYTSSYFPIYNVPIGWRTFEAYGNWYYGSTTQYIYPGTNYVTITTY